MTNNFSHCFTAGLEPAIFVKYSTPSGKPLVHLAPRPVFMPNYAGWGFFKFNPWRAKFDEQIRKHIEVSYTDWDKSVDCSSQ